MFDSLSTPIKPSFARVTKRLICLSLTVTGLAAHGDNVATNQQYEQLTDYKAQVVFTGSPSSTYTSQNQQNKLAAATFAQNACLAEHPASPADQGYCELTRLGDAYITTAQQIKAKVGNEPHPLFLWRYQRGNAIVYLGGSIHLLKAGLHPLPAQYQQAFDATDKLVLEVDLSRYTPQQLQFKSMQYALLTNQQTLPGVLPTDIYTSLRQATGEYGLPLAQMSQFKPGFVTQQLAVLALMAAGYNPAQGMESHFTAQASNKQILELETLDFQFDLLMNQPLATQVEMTKDMLKQMDSFEPYTVELIRAWLAGDDAAFKEAFDAQSGTSPAAQAFMFELMDKRNHGMAEKIANYLQSPGRYFVLVGAAHYVGNNSIINLLKSKGFTGQRIHSNQSITP